MSLPKIILVHEERERDGTKYMLANYNLQAAAGDEVRVIGTYKLVGKCRVVKRPVRLNEIKVR